MLESVLEDQLRQRNEAFDRLERAYRQRDPVMVFVKIDPLLRNLNTDPRYPALLVKVKLVD
jgi:hypothetical protein